ncbi:hypothetical protein G6F64_014047 [Rhizopus arrhizus]|uniref:Uncharacterized protein n=1 Tax=Rhizopus oryzae TaxID=64495 RepID=A0A9P6WU51_RHIOR|nr:hypothetical protein G6F64_014047 [Rhizopus arrhizus]
MSGTVSISCPINRPTVRGSSRRAESETAIAQCSTSCSRPSTPSTAAKGWVGATANTNSTVPSGSTTYPPPLGPSPGAPTSRSARLSSSASQVPDSASPISRSRVGASASRNAAMSGPSSQVGNTESTARGSSGSQPDATRRTRNSSSRAARSRCRPSSSNARPASVGSARGPTRSNSCTPRSSSSLATV